MYVQKEAAAKVTFALRLREATSEATAAEYLPVVREDEFFTGTFRIIGVQHKDGFRETLRLYTLGEPSAAVRV